LIPPDSEETFATSRLATTTTMHEEPMSPFDMAATRKSI